MLKALSFLTARMDTKLALFLIVTGLLPLAVAGYLTVHFASETLRQQVTSSLQVVADSKAQRIEDYLRSRVSEVTIQSRSRKVLGLTQQLSDLFHRSGIHSPAYAAIAADAREHFARYAPPSYYDNVLLIDADGDVVFSAVPSATLGVNLRSTKGNKSLSNVFDDVGMTLSGENSDYEMDPVTGVQRAYVAAPIFKNGVLMGVVAFRINNRELFAIAGDYAGLGETGETVIGRREGDGILLMTPTRHDPTAAFRRWISDAAPDCLPMREATRGNSGIGQARDYRGTEVLAVWKYLPALRCGLVVKIDETEAFAPIRTLRDAAVLLGCLVALAVTLVAPLAARHLAAPIRKLVETTRAFSAGELTRRASIHSDDEIGNLADVFNHMADTIQQQIDSLSRAGHELELRVEERTAALEKANLALQTEVAEHQRAEESLRESEERFSGAFEHAPIGVALVSPSGRWLKVNREVCDLVGYSEEELLTRTFQDLTHPDDLEADLEHVRRLLAGEVRSYQIEKRYIHQRGHVVPALLNVSLVRDERGRPRYFISQIQDITERKQAEEALAYERDLLRTLLDNSPDLIYFKDAHSRFIKCSQAMSRQFGVKSSDEMIGKTDFDFFDDAHARPAFEDEQEIIRTGIPIIGKVEREVWQGGREETWVLTTKMPFRDKDGEIIGTFGVSKNITALKRAEAKLADEQARLQFMFESMPVGVALARTYPDGRLERIVNDAHLRICGLTREQDRIPGIYPKISHPEDYARQSELLRNVGEGQAGQFSFEKRYVRLDGEIVWVVYSFQRRMHGDGSFEELTTVVDITELKRSEEARRESQALYHSLVDHVPAGIFRKDADGRFVFANPWYCRLKGMSEDQLLGRTSLEIALEKASDPTAMWRPEFARAAQVHHQQILQTGQSVEMEEVYTGPDGEPQYFHLVKSAVFGPDRKIVGTQGVVFDITELKRVEAAQRETSALLETLLQNATDDIYFKDLESRFVYFSQSMLKHFRRADPSEIKGHTDFDFFSEEHARPAYEAEQEVIRTGRALLNLEEKETHIDGGVTWALTSKMPWRDKAGHIIGTMGISKDITERKEIEQALSLTLERLQIAVKAGKAGTWDHDLLTGKVDWDGEMLALYGVAADDLAFGIERWHNALHPEDRPAAIALYDAVQQGARNSFDTEFRIHRADDGSLRFIRAMGVLLRDESGRPARMTGVNWDVTEERIREKKLAEALAQEKELSEKAQAGSRAKSEFLAVMSHEIRTPMNGILGFSELLAAAPNLPADCRDYVKTIASSGEALLRIIDDILDFSRLEAGGLKIEPSLFSSRQILEDVHTLLAPRAAEKRLEFLLEVDEGAPERLWNDAGRLRQILLNLVGNALKFTAHGSIVLGLRPSTVPLKDGETGVDFFVRDTGTGIPADKLSHVFEPFAQADSSISRRYGGTGLGLAISQNLVELMGGKLTVRSVVGEGSEFSVALPTGMPQGAEPSVLDVAGETLDETFAARHPRRILLVEDDQVNRKLLLIMLRKLGYTALTARDGVEAVEIYRQERPDFILMDLQMPRKGGLEATVEIRALENATPGGKRAFISALTANIVAEDRRECFEVGMDAHLNKPIKRALLAKVLEQAGDGETPA
jgi:PAS domain S-box-containing protein